MKTVEIAKANEKKVESAEEANKTSSHQKVDDSFEKLFYDVIDVFAYSKFYEITINPSEKSNIAYVNFIKSLYGNFKENQEFLMCFFGKQEYENLALIIDEFCAEKFRNFVNIRTFVKNKDEVDKKISEFLSANSRSIELVKKEIEENPEHENLEIIIKNLQKQDPKRFKNLIDFEVNRIELKNINDVLGYMASDKNMKPSPLFLKEIKECSRLQGKGLNKNKFSCVIS